MTSSVFPDVNVWLAMVFTGHSHHVKAMQWFTSLPQDQELIFCRFTQLGLLRLLSLSQVMGTKVKTQREAWGIFDVLMVDGKARLLQEPLSLDGTFRRHSNSDSVAPQQWADAYLAAFADQYGMSLVTFDKALAARAANPILLS
jgi:uncharacterized protein